MSGGLYRSANAGNGGPHGVEMTPAKPPGIEPVDPEPPLVVEEEASAASNSAVMAIGSLVSRGTGFVRTLILTAALGGALVGNAYTTAQVVPGMIYEFLIGGILSSVVIPVLVRRSKADADGGQAYSQRLLTLAVVALGIAALLGTVTASVLTTIYADDTSGPAFQDLVTKLSYLMLPMIFFIGLSGIIGAILNTRGHFAAPMWTPIINNLVVIGTAALYIAIYGAKLIRPDQMTVGQITLIGGGTLLGVVVQAVGLLPALRKVGFRWRWRFDFRELGLGELARVGGWAFCYVVVSQIGLIIVFRLLNQAGGEKAAGPLIYNNVFLLMMMAHGIIAVSIMTALMPRMSAAAADRRWPDLAADLSRGTRMITAVLTPLAICYAVLAAPIAVALFQNGAFDKENATATSLVLVVAAVALVPFSISQLFTIAFYACQDTRMAALVNIPVVLIRLVVQVGLFVALSAKFTASGLMLGNAVSYVAAALLSAWLLRRRIGTIGLGGILVTFVKVGVAAVGATIVGLAVVYVLPGGWSPDKIESFLQLVVAGAAILITYVGIAVGLKVTEITDVVGMVRRKIGR